MRFRATKEGYIPSTSEVTAEKGAKKTNVSLSMYPEAKNNGFWLIDSEGYTHIKASKVHTKESTDQRIVGLYNVGNVQASQKTPSFVFRTSLRKEQLKQLDLELHQLKFMDKTTFNTLTGPKEVDIDLWITKAQATFEIKALGADDHFLIEVSKPLEKGLYAFHSHNILNNNEFVEKIDLPKELLMGFPFEIK